MVRIKSSKAIRALKTDLLNNDWQDVYVEDIKAFLNKFLIFYEDTVP